MDGSPRDTVTSIMICLDNTCLCKLFDGNVFLISSNSQNAESWKLQAIKDIKAVTGVDVHNLQLFKWFKISIPISESQYSYVMSVYYKTQFTIDQKRKIVLPSGYVWLSYTNLHGYFARMAMTSAILLELYPKLSIAVFNYDDHNEQFLQFGCIVEVSTNTLYTKSGTNSEMFINSTSLKPVQISLYKDFFGTCSPNILMSFYHFNIIMSKFGLTGNIVVHIFRAADYLNIGFISYRDFACVVALLDPLTDHEGISAEVRKRFIFRMFDKDGDGFLNREELESLIAFVRANNDPDVKACLQSMRMTANKKLPYSEFSTGIDMLHLRGLPLALRAPKSCNKVYKGERASDAHRNSEFTTMQNIAFQVKQQKVHSLGSHTLKIMKSGNVINIENIWGLRDVCSNNTLLEAGITRELRHLSCEINSSTVLFNEVIKNLRFLSFLNNVGSNNRGNSLDDFTWGTLSDALYGNRLIQVCKYAKKIVAMEKRLIELKAPVYILGSIHGNYGDLIYFEKVLWPRCPGYLPGSLLFLGNYIDRAPYGIEVVSYLFCYKNLYPNKIFLLRGSHEHRKIQQKDCFLNECLKKFGLVLGRDVWQAVNEVLDSLPLAATIDDKLLCVHSGIPTPTACILAKSINNIPNPLIDPEKGSQIAWEILWNEPLKRGEEHVKQIGDTGQSSDGFARNLKRGTGYTFTNNALNKFLDTNFYSHLVRTNEPVQRGFTFTNKGRLVTVFSSSRYGNQSNDAACLLVDRGKIRGIRLCLKSRMSYK